VLSVEVSATEVPEAADEFYDWQLEGLRVESVDGADLGVVVEVVHLPGQDLLAVRPDDEVGPESRTGPESASVLVPFVSAIVPHIDIAAGRITCDPPLGLFPPTNLVTGPPADADPGGA
jgi:16S rRNA processing protein RimM